MTSSAAATVPIQLRCSRLRASCTRLRQSLVLLKNERKLLPLAKAAQRIFVAGRGADSLGLQCGGWTLDWQGSADHQIPGGTTILAGIRSAVSKQTEVSYAADGHGAAGADVAVVVVGEKPYAEMKGDASELALAPEDAALVARVKSAGVPLVVILLSGRPLILGQVLDQADALVAAWLPGSEGQGVADVLFGDFNPTGKLARSWPRTMAQVPLVDGKRQNAPLFPLGFGLHY